jgi:hypothetical protein
MIQPFVNSYNETICQTLGAAIDAAMSEVVNRTPLVKKIVDDIWYEVVQRLHDSIDDYLGENLKDTLCARAAEVAEHMLRDALAGDDKELRNLFGFNDWYMKHSYVGQLPTQWALIDALAKRHQGLIVDERIKQRDREIELLRLCITNLKRELAYFKGEMSHEQPYNPPEAEI